MKEADIRNRIAFQRYLELVESDAKKYCIGPGRVRSVNCPACGAGEHAPQFTKAGFDYVLCTECETLFANPRPTAAALEAFYADSESSRYWVKEFFEPVAEIRRQKIFRPRAEYVAERLPQLASKTIGDVGAGFGIFLDELKKLKPGARLIAIEPSADMAAICRGKGFEVLESPVELVTGHDGAFDLITSFELLEHLSAPRDLVEQAFKLLAPGGYFLATTLSGRGFDIQVLWEKSKSVTPPHHLNFLNPASLSRLCTEVGFVVEEISTPGVLDWDILDNAMKSGEGSGERFWRTVSQQGDDQCKRDFQAWLTANGFSSHMRVLARKP